MSGCFHSGFNPERLTHDFWSKVEFSIFLFIVEFDYEMMFGDVLERRKFPVWLAAMLEFCPKELAHDFGLKLEIFYKVV